MLSEKAVYFRIIREAGVWILPKYRFKFFHGAKFIVVTSIVLAVVVFSVLAHNIKKTASASLYSEGNVSSSESATSNKPANEDAVKAYYIKTLGFQPMLPSYLPGGLKILHSTVAISDDTTDGHYVDFTVDLYNPSFSVHKGSEAFNQVASSEPNTTAKMPAEITIGEMPEALYNKLQARSPHAIVKNLPPHVHVQKTPPSSSFQMQKRNVTKDGLKITILHMPSVGDGSETAVGFSKSGVRYSVSAMKNTATAGYSTDKLIKILVSLSVPEKDKPTEISTNGYGTLTDAEKALTFKPTVPTFIPEGFRVVANRSDAPMGASDKRTGVPGFLPSEPSSGQTETGIKSQGSVESHFSISFSKGQATIDIHEDYTMPDQGGIIPPNAISNAKSEVINGHKVYFGEENLPNGTGTNVSLTYSWKDPATEVVYKVNGFNPINRVVVDKATLKKVVASMLK
ncbi:hypothetical protein [Alicyclobacillus sp. SO9]|uniref:hypothetical protein n=1 Tax=Alicyclobacillus sp. SO9 TaxID=2665646 RepID=UPI001937B8C2|nr:hypothetical protein [Alicyclobacillus sp. SO9]QQE79707.1 hypothetical protein GI364_04245 [Alicyclobacillus sp. SO9]